MNEVYQPKKLNLITVKEFSDKYDIPYTIAYQATYRIKRNYDYERMYPEKELFYAMHEIVGERIQKITKQLKDIISIKHKLIEK